MAASMATLTRAAPKIRVRQVTCNLVDIRPPAVMIEAGRYGIECPPFDYQIGLTPLSVIEPERSVQGVRECSRRPIRAHCSIDPWAHHLDSETCRTTWTSMTGGGNVAHRFVRL